MSAVDRYLEVGNGYVNECRYAEALPWLESAVALAEAGDVDGPVDPVSLFMALEAVSFCCLSLDRFGDAVSWYERAIAAAPDEAELGACLENVAFCHASLNAYGKARACHERASVHLNARTAVLTRRPKAHCHAGQRDLADVPERHSEAVRRPASAAPLEWLAAVEAPFPGEWREILNEQVPFYRGLRDGELQRFEAKLKAFVYTKTFSSKQIVVTEEVKVVVAATACRLTMNLPWEDYARLRHVSVHAEALAREGHTRVTGRAGHIKVAVSWVDLIAGLADPADGDNVGYHEFAHALDVADGSMDGEAPGPPTDVYLVWRHVMSSGLAEVRRALAAGADPPIDGYAGESEAEFFAVATEWFFERPGDLRARLPAVYEILRRFYRQDPGVVRASPLSAWSPG